MSGIFVAFEGGEGSGKSTTLSHVATRLRNQGFPVTTTREPGGTPLAESLRAAILDTPDMHPTTELTLFMAARADHVHRVIAPAIQRGDIVLCDRFHDSTLAYQGAARGHGIDHTRDLSLWACGGMLPDLTLLLDIDPAIGLARASDANRMEAEALTFHRTVNTTLRDLADRDPHRYHVIDATLTPHHVHRNAFDAVDTFYRQHRGLTASTERSPFTPAG